MARRSDISLSLSGSGGLIWGAIMFHGFNRLDGRVHKHGWQRPSPGAASVHSTTFSRCCWCLLPADMTSIPSPAALDAFLPMMGPIAEEPCFSAKEDEILVKIESMVEDPLDWKDVDTVTQEYSHSIHGCDFSGHIVSIGGQVTCGLSLGDHVVGFVLSNAIKHSSYVDPSSNTRYIRLAGELAWKVPRGTFTHEAAAKARLGRFRYMFGVSR